MRLVTFRERIKNLASERQPAFFLFGSVFLLYAQKKNELHKQQRSQRLISKHLLRNLLQRFGSQRRNTLKHRILTLIFIIMEKRLSHIQRQILEIIGSHRYLTDSLLLNRFQLHCRKRLFTKALQLLPYQTDASIHILGVATKINTERTGIRVRNQVTLYRIDQSARATTRSADCSFPVRPTNY